MKWRAGSSWTPWEWRTGVACRARACWRSDRGSQYASEPCQLLGEHGIGCSTSGVGQCWDDAPAESFFATLKKELVHDEDYQTRGEARASIFEYIEVFYNNQSLHSSLGYVTQAAYFYCVV